jgi:hypothetical protein
LTDEQMIKEIIERRRQWGETRWSDFDWLMNHIERQQKEIEYLKEANSINSIVNQSINEKVERYEKALKDIRNVSTLDEYEGANPNSLLKACYDIAKGAAEPIVV